MAQEATPQEPVPEPEVLAGTAVEGAAPGGNPPDAELPAAASTLPTGRRRGWLVVLGMVLGVAFLLVFFIVSVTLLDFTESERFCTSCHVMYPEKIAYHNSPHARAECGTCHVGPGAVPAIQAKLANLRYLWIYPLGRYEKPIKSPIHSLRPVEVVCEQCHWPEKFYPSRLLSLSNYAPDEGNSLTRTELVLKTGGGTQEAGLGRGIHWHIENPVYYIATDEKRQQIPWVQAEYNGVITTYVDVISRLTTADLARYETRVMDCVDCHNRASHNFRRPGDLLDEALATGQIPADLPYIKQQGVAVLERDYASEAEAAAAIAAVTDFYRTEQPQVYAAREADVKLAVAALQDIFDRTQFPFMGVDWQTHTNNIGHKDFPGCFRCHDGKHLSPDNQAIRLECNICHSIPQVALPGQPLPPIYTAPTHPEPESHRSTTWLSEHRYKFDVSCAQCHTVDNPGGSDNSSFCSNSACHATDWQYAGLNAPRIRELAAPPSKPKGLPNPIPHPIGAATDCKVCHGPEGVRPAPENHASFTPDMCTGCHQPTVQETPVVVTPTPAPTETPAAATPGATSTPMQPAGGPRAIPHEVTGREQCLLCHDPAGNIKPAPPDHAGRTEDTCQMCHKPAASGMGGEPQPTVTAEPGERGKGDSEKPPSIPHELAGREDCLLCHNPAGGIKPAPPDHAGRANESCQMCHKPED